MDASSHTEFFSAIGAFERIPDVITKRVWSPIVWTNGKRNKKNFVSSDLIALDFDNGEWTLADAVTYCEKAKLKAIIGTSKSHQIMKNGSAPCDRFRLVIAAGRTTSVDDFEYTMRIFMANMPCDKSCKDAARYYFPCKEVVWSRLEGAEAQWLPCPFEETEEAKALAIAAVSRSEWRDLMSLPSYIWTYILAGTEQGNRHKACYMLGCEFAKRGFSEAETMHELQKHKSPLLAIGVDDVRRAVGNGYARVADYRVAGNVTDIRDRKKEKA